MANGNGTTGTAANGAITSQVVSQPKKRSIFHELNFMLSSWYYGLNLLLTASYVVIREQYRHAPIREGMLFMGDVSDYESWERYVAFLCGCYGAFRFIKARSRLAGLTALLNFTQLFVAIMAFVCNPVLLAYLVLAYVLIYLLFPQPFYPIHDHLEPLTPEGLTEDVKNPTTDVAWVVYYYAPWHPGCRETAPDVADIASRYGTEKLKFAELNLGEYNKLASPLGIDLSPVSQQLPTIALYEKGEEVARLPLKKAKGAGFKAKDVVRVLELDMRHARSLQKASDKKGQ